MTAKEHGMFRNRSKVVFFSALLGTLYTLYLVFYFSGAVSGSQREAQLGAAIATALVTPHMVLVGLAAIFNWVGFFNNKVWGALTAGILYAVAGLIFLAYFIFVIPMIVLRFIGVSILSRINDREAPGQTV